MDCWLFDLTILADLAVLTRPRQSMPPPNRYNRADLDTVRRRLFDDDLANGPVLRDAPAAFVDLADGPVLRGAPAAFVDLADGTVIPEASVAPVDLADGPAMRDAPEVPVHGDPTRYWLLPERAINVNPVPPALNRPIVRYVDWNTDDNGTCQICIESMDVSRFNARAFDCPHYWLHSTCLTELSRAPQLALRFPIRRCNRRRWPMEHTTGFTDPRNDEVPEEVS